MIERALSISSSELRCNLLPIYGDTHLTKTIATGMSIRKIVISEENYCYYWPRIISYIKLSDLAIMDLRPFSAPREPVNWNVLLELGVSYNFTSSHIILTKSRAFLKKRLSNLAGVQIDKPPRGNIIEFLSTLITSRLAGKIGKL